MAFLATSQAKINPFLAVGPRRADGYHELVTVFHAVDLREDVHVAFAADGIDRLMFVGPIDTTALDTGHDNLVWRAVEAVAARGELSRRQALDITVTKRIPIQGGMAGGSADAAATLVAANDAFGTGLGRTELLGIAAELGSDVPFCLVGGTALGTGRGECLEPVDAPPLWWVIVTAPAGLSTPAVYATFDELHRVGAGERAAMVDPGRTDADAMISALRAGDPQAIAALLRNDLQAAAILLAPHLADTLAAGRDAGALGGVVSGSGPSVALLCADEAHARLVAGRMLNGGHSAIAARGGLGPQA